MNDTRLRHIFLYILTAVFILPIRAGHTDYLLGGSLVVTNGRIDKVLFAGGYARGIDTGATTDRFVFYYYNQDHLGNNREVVDAKGRVRQITSYYPFGAPYADEAAVRSPELQPYKYNDKELDLMHGLNTYDYGARQYDPILARWDRVDPLAEKYYPFSPYAYCNNNPVMYIDPDGRDWYSSLDSIGNNNGQTICQTQIHYTDCTSQDQLAENNIDGTYLGRTVVLFEGYYDERLGKDNTLDGPNSKHATATGITGSVLVIIFSE